MIVQLDLEVLKAHNLSVNEWISLYLIHKNQAHYVFETVGNVEFDKLQEDGWLRMIGDDINDWVVRSKFKNLIENKGDQMWYELCKHLPFKVPGSGGYRVLRAKDPDARSNKKARKMYLDIVKSNKPLHDKIIKCVDIEVRTTDIKYMQNIETWIRNRTWEKYEDQINPSIGEEQQTQGYGQKLI